MNDSEYHNLAGLAINTLLDAMEAADQGGIIDVEYQDGVITIGLPAGKQLVVSKHVPTKQLWLSSPVSGGLHFGYCKDWVLADGRTLGQVLSQELKTLAGIEVHF